MKRAFTLIELLIVVAIIAILSVIAIPNYLDATIRAKVSAAKSNLRLVATELEMIHLDTNDYPRAWTWHWPCTLIFYDEDMAKRVDKDYLLDPFLPHRFFYHADQKEVGEELKRARAPFGGLVYWRFTPGKPEWLGCWENECPENWSVAAHFAGAWSLFSIGPDLKIEGPNYYSQSCDSGVTCESPPHNYWEESFFRDYDPTNGIVSEGNIFRTQKNPSKLGVHPQYFDEEDCDTLTE